VRQAILDAAEAEFLPHGYAAVPLTDIAARAGFTKGAIYSNFGGKPDLFAAVCADHYDTIADQIIGLGVSRLADLGHEQAVAAIADRLADVVVDNGGWQLLLAEFRALARHDVQVAGAYARLRSQQRQRLAQRLGEAISPTRGTTELTADATLILGAVGDLGVEHAIDPIEMPRALVATTLARLLDGILR